MNINPISAVNATLPAAGLLPSGGTEETPSAGGNFATALAGQLDKVQEMQGTADSLAVEAATGRLEDVHDYTIAATQAKLATELTVAVRNKAVEAFNEIMRMAG